MRPELWEDCKQRNVNGAIGWYYFLALFVYINFLLNVIFPFYKIGLSIATSRTSTGPNNS